jgi:hypothetical protein
VSVPVFQQPANVAGALWVILVFNLFQAGMAAELSANPSNYRAVLKKVRPGDTVTLAAGTYLRLPLLQLNGTPDSWITVTGPSSGPPAVIVPGGAEYNAIEILNSSYLSIENLTINSQGIPGSFGISAGGQEDNVTHDIRLDNNTFIGQNGNQQTDAISTKTPTWRWTIRNNRILGAGTGLYLGNSDGSQPFVAGIIENNLIQDTIGYNMEIKYQSSLPADSGMPLEPTSTIIRNNVFIKNDQPSPDGDRPNLLVGSFPSNGSGALNMYEIYGNYFYHNGREALLQASGRVSIHDNIFVDGGYAAVVLRNHDGPLKIAYVYNNTVHTVQRGIFFANRALIDDAVVGNLVFASQPISGAIMRNAANIVDTYENASAYVTAASSEPGAANFYPVTGRCQGPPIDLSLFHTDTDYILDFNGAPKNSAKGAIVFRGAYSGDGNNPGWRLQAERKLPNAPRAPAPVLVWIDPPGVKAGKPTSVTLTGANFTSDATVAITGAGVTVTDVQVSDSTQITAKVTITASAAHARHDLTVVTSSGTTSPLSLRVHSGQTAGKP